MIVLTPAEKKQKQQNCHSKKKASATIKKDSFVQIHISIPLELLTNIEQNVEGLSRSEKLRKCIEKGYKMLSNQASQHRGRGLILSSPPQPPKR